MTSDFEKRVQGTTEATGSPADVTAGGTRPGYAASGTTTGGSQSGFGQPTSGTWAEGTTPGAGEAHGVKSAVGREASAAKAEIGSAAEQVKQGVAGLGETAREKAVEGVEKGKSQITSSLGDFAAAVRKASDELGERDQSMAAGLVREVANGLEQATGAIHGKSVQDLSRSVASFARRQPTTFLIGAALAGIALGRFARASGENAASDTAGGRWNEDERERDGSGRYAESRYGGGRSYGGSRYDDDLYGNHGGATRASDTGLTPGRSAASTSMPVSPPVSAGTVQPTSTTAGGTTSGGSSSWRSTSGSHGTDSLSTGATSTSGTGTAPAEGPSDAALGRGSGSFNPEGDRDVR